MVYLPGVGVREAAFGGEQRWQTSVASAAALMRRGASAGVSFALKTSATRSVGVTRRTAF